MSEKKWTFVLVGCLAAILISGCNCTNAAVSVYEVLLDSPTGYTIVSSLTPSFAWHGSDTCEPDKFRIRVDENVLYGGDYADVYVSGDLSAYTLSGDSLQPGREYVWYMMASNDYDPEESGDYIGPESEKGFFYTGPVCSGETLVAPDLEYPREHYSEQLDNWITHQHLQEFKWSYAGGCLPVSYDYQFASDPGFTDIVLSGTTTEPYIQHILEQFPNCSSIFWRVAANDGITVGPWSDAWQFHWVTDDTCWQTHYISDESARIKVILFEDVCDLTGYNVPSNSRLELGCKRWEKSTLVAGDGVMNNSDFWMWDFRADLGAGPCPSSGLDQRKFGFYWGQDYFYVLTPGTYCVSISRSQTIGNGSTNLTKGLWTEPRMDSIVAEKTVEFGPGMHDLILEFGWDRFEPITLYYPIPENIHCRVGPDPICDPLKVPLQGELLPILARDQQTEWKLTSYEGELCFVYLESELIDQELTRIDNNQWLTADLPFYEPQPPCPIPAPEPAKNCSAYTDYRSCRSAGCSWTYTATNIGYCASR